MEICGKSVPGCGNSQGKGPEVGVCLEHGIVGAWGGDEVRGVLGWGGVQATWRLGGQGGPWVEGELLVALL